MDENAIADDHVCGQFGGDDDEDDNFCPVVGDVQSPSDDEAEMSDESRSSSDNDSVLAQIQLSRQPCKQMVKSFNEHVQWAGSPVFGMTDAQCGVLTLLEKLRKTKASLSTCEAVMEWHLSASGELRPGQSLASCESCVSRERSHETL